MRYTPQLFASVVMSAFLALLEGTLFRGDSEVKQRLAALLLLAASIARTQEAQNELERSIQNWTGPTASSRSMPATSSCAAFSRSTSSRPRWARATTARAPVDEHLNGAKDATEAKLYFEVSGLSNYVFYEDPR